MSGVSERANGRASGPILQSVFLVILAHSATDAGKRLAESAPLGGGQKEGRIIGGV